MNVEFVAAEAAIQDVGFSDPVYDGVVAVTGVKAVDASNGPQDVVSAAADQCVVALIASQRICSGSPEKTVVALTADETSARGLAQIDNRVGGATRRVRRCQIGCQDQVAFAGIGSAAIEGPDDQVILAIAIHVTGRGGGETGTVERLGAYERVGGRVAGC